MEKKHEFKKSTDTGRQYFRNQGIESVLDQATSIVWTTGGSMVPVIQIFIYCDVGVKSLFSEKSIPYIAIQHRFFYTMRYCES